MFVMGCYGHKLPNNAVLFAHHLILDVPGGSSHLGYRRRVPFWHNPHMRVKSSAAGERKEAMLKSKSLESIFGKFGFLGDAYSWE